MRSLEGSRLNDVLYSWRGLSGARHICRIVPIAAESVIVQFSQVLVIGVARLEQSVRPLCFMMSEEFATPKGYRIRRAAVQDNGSEWHLYFENTPQKVRDLAVALRLL